MFVSSATDTLLADDPRSEVLAYAGVQFPAGNALQTEVVAFVIAFSLHVIYSLDAKQVHRLQNVFDVPIENRNHINLTHSMLDLVGSFVQD